MLTLLILAAGESSRMLSPKALLKIRDETFTECIIRKAGLAGIPSINLITGPDHEAIIRSLPREVRCIKNENYMQGQISSLQKGISALEDIATEVMVWPVDQPLVEIHTVKRILEAYKLEKKALTIPVFDTRKGHPVVYRKRAMQAALALQSHQTGKDLQSLFTNDITWVDVDDSGVVTDIDTPEDYDKYIRSLS